MRAPVESISVTRRSSSSSADVPAAASLSTICASPLGAAEEQRALQLDDQHGCALLMQDFQLRRIAGYRRDRTASHR